MTQKSGKLYLLFSILFSTNLLAASKLKNSEALFFTENKGQITDQYAHPRNDIQFAIKDKGMTLFVGNGQLHYQFTKLEDANLPSNEQINDEDKSIIAFGKKTYKEAFAQRQIRSYRMDVELVGANIHAPVVTDEPLAYYENFYLSGCPESGATAHTFRKITYKKIYDNIDWVLYIKNNQLEHEFIVGPGGDPSKIKIRYNGQTTLKINADGSIIATTPMGTIREQKPVCILADGRKAPSSYLLRSNTLTYNLKGADGVVVIDPILEWGTYYGPDTVTNIMYSVAADASAGIFASGLSWSGTDGTIATTGSYQATYGGGCDAFLVKFDSSGNRLWATYYGGTGGDWGVGVAVDHSNNILLCGTTQSTTGISTTGSHQSTYGGGAWDGFLVKFTPAGTRLWGTYLGGPAVVYAANVSCDASDNIFFSGVTTDNINIGTPGSFRSTRAGGVDAFLQKFTPAGVRIWGTYFGGGSDEFGGVHCNDGINSFLCGWTFSSTTITTPLCHKPAFSAGSTDAFITKFDIDGARLWGTYYGGNASETGGGIACDRNGDLYFMGATSSDTGIATPGSFQPTPGGGSDAFLVKLNPELGYRIWATYFGGPFAETCDLSRITCDDSNNVYIPGYTASVTGIASPEAWQPAYGGGDDDAFFAKFSQTGERVWSSYYGGMGVDEPTGCAHDGKGVYMCGRTTSPNNIATPGGFLPTGGGGVYYQGFVAKFYTPDTGSTTLSVRNATVATHEVGIYPNPNNGSFTVSGALDAGANVASLSIADITGKTVWTGSADLLNGRINKQINIGGTLPTGVYILKATTGNRTEIVRFTKE